MVSLLINASKLENQIAVCFHLELVLLCALIHTILIGRWLIIQMQFAPGEQSLSQLALTLDRSVNYKSSGGTG